MSFKAEPQVLEMQGRKIVVAEDGTMTIYGGDEALQVVGARAGPARETAEAEYFTGALPRLLGAGRRQQLASGCWPLHAAECAGGRSAGRPRAARA